MPATSSLAKFIAHEFIISTTIHPSATNAHKFCTMRPPLLSPKLPSSSRIHSSVLFRRGRTLVLSRSSESEPEGVSAAEDDEWLLKLPDKKKPLYSHSLPCIEAWLKKLGFFQSKEDRAVWFVEKSDWHAQLSLDVTDLYIRYMKSGPINLEKDVERRFSYALSREDIENAILGGP